MKILDIIPTQNSLRNYKTVEQCVARLEKGERLTPINLSLMEDWVTYLHDGMHRLCAMHLYGMTHITEEMYVAKVMTYEQYASINWKVGYVTPFNIRTECRIPDLYKWKSEVFRIKGESGEAWAEMFIACNKESYIEKRRVWNVEDVLKGIKV